MKTPLWVFQTSIKDPVWLNCKTIVCHPLSTPTEMRGYMVVLEQVGPPIDPIKAAL